MTRTSRYVHNNVIDLSVWLSSSSHGPFPFSCQTLTCTTIVKLFLICYPAFLVEEKVSDKNSTNV